MSRGVGIWQTNVRGKTQPTIVYNGVRLLNVQYETLTIGRLMFDNQYDLNVRCMLVAKDIASDRKALMETGHRFLDGMVIRLKSLDVNKRRLGEAVFDWEAKWCVVWKSLSESELNDLDVKELAQA